MSHPSSQQLAIATDRLRQIDRHFARLIDTIGPCGLPTHDTRSHLDALVEAIIMQQLSPSGARAIYTRLLRRFECERLPSAEVLLACPPASLREIGLSPAKLSAIRGLSLRIASGHLDLDDLAGCDDDAVITTLSSLPGVGPWTAQMYLIFHLCRIDVWPMNDLALRTALMRLYSPPQPIDDATMTSIGDLFRPQRSVASWYLWRSLEVARASDIFRPMFDATSLEPR